ncbi:TatD family hydrolase, partial [Candidatus Daviesbacteria bacterium]|nr:TatD family hydrolase [Candidatus Daviesbacteria bacterium]
MIQRAADVGVSAIINVGVDVETSRKALAQTKDLFIYSTIGIHPHESFLDGDIAELEKIYLSNPEKVVAVGECGLDFFQNNNDNDHNSYKSHNFYNLQIKLFEAQINLA